MPWGMREATAGGHGVRPGEAGRLERLRGARESSLCASLIYTTGTCALGRCRDPTYALSNAREWQEGRGLALKQGHRR